MSCHSVLGVCNAGTTDELSDDDTRGPDQPLTHTSAAAQPGLKLVTIPEIEAALRPVPACIWNCLPSFLPWLYFIVGVSFGARCVWGPNSS
jgi:hypothetical protein